MATFAGALAFLAPGLAAGLALPACARAAAFALASAFASAWALAAASFFAALFSALAADWSSLRAFDGRGSFAAVPAGLGVAIIAMRASERPPRIAA
ncbi:hypothetical protein [Aquisphaera giovannonii]|uniref:hypothetical protein n=1 Tax=Aquisphaera giovannonii TaxID=406548 RepID=UPI00143DA93E|nr:hypothetical protein [Aquisphaera giovannonii]